MTKTRICIRIALVLAAGIVVAEPAAAAQICAARKITATGASSNLSFFARSRARTAWVGKVSKESRLGPTYSQWLRARERRVVCRKLDTQIICIAAALPCRNVSAILQPSTEATPSLTKPVPVRPL